ncbi:MAG: hypothetical protein KAW39_04285 [Thermoplasmata archaeon]|nr:hypothetical protein [Thermoplasmata archaeon]
MSGSVLVYKGGLSLGLVTYIKIMLGVENPSFDGREKAVCDTIEWTQGGPGELRLRKVPD